MGPIPRRHARRRQLEEATRFFEEVEGEVHSFAIYALSVRFGGDALEQFRAIVDRRGLTVVGEGGYA